MIKIHPYLNFNGNCLEAFEFYKSVFGGDFPYVGFFKDMPQDPEHPMPEHLNNLVMHMSLPIGEESTIMGSDVAEEFTPKAEFGNNISLMISVDTKAEVDALWAKLIVGGTVVMPLEDAFWGDYFGALIDRFGINWMIIAPSKQ